MSVYDAVTQELPVVAFDDDESAVDPRLVFPDEVTAVVSLNELPELAADAETRVNLIRYLLNCPDWNG